MHSNTRPTRDRSSPAGIADGSAGCMRGNQRTAGTTLRPLHGPARSCRSARRSKYLGRVGEPSKLHSQASSRQDKPAPPIPASNERPGPQGPRLYRYRASLGATCSRWVGDFPPRKSDRNQFSRPATATAGLVPSAARPAAFSPRPQHQHRRREHRNGRPHTGGGVRMPFRKISLTGKIT